MSTKTLDREASMIQIIEAFPGTTREQASEVIDMFGLPHVYKPGVVMNLLDDIMPPEAVLSYRKVVESLQGDWQFDTYGYALREAPADVQPDAFMQAMVVSGDKGDDERVMEIIKPALDGPSSEAQVSGLGIAEFVVLHSISENAIISKKPNNLPGRLVHADDYMRVIDVRGLSVDEKTKVFVGLTEHLGVEAD